MYITFILASLTIVLLLISIIAIVYVCQMRRKLKNTHHSDSPTLEFFKILGEKFNYMVYDRNLCIVHAHNNQPEILMNFSAKHFVGFDIRELEQYVSAENREQAHFVTENILLASREQKNRYFEYTTVNCSDGKIYYAFCFVICKEDGLLYTCTTGIEAKDVFQAREHFYNTEINSAFGHVSVGIYVRSFGKDSKYEMFNMMAQHFYGTNDVLQSGNWDQKEEDHYDNAAINSVYAVTYEKPILDKNGNIIRWLQVIKRKKELKEGEGYMVTTTLLDITQRKREEVELIETRQNLELAIGSANISIWLYRRDEHLFYPLYGKIKFLAGVRYNTLINRIYEPYRTEFVAAFDRLLDGTSEKEIAICMVWDEESGTDIYYEIQMTTSGIDKDSKVISIVGTLRDITYQYIHKRELENQEKKIQLAIETSDLVQWEYNNVTHLFNSSNERIKSKETVLTYEDYCRAIHPGDLEKTRQIVELMDAGCDQTILFNKRIRYSEDDYWHYTTVYGAPFEKDLNGRVTKYTGFRRDDTEWKNVNERLEEEKKKAQEADMLKSAFLANMSHEIRTPLNAIVGFSQLLLTTDDLSEKEEYAQIINVNNDLLLRLIGDILDLSKIESGMMELKREKFDLAPFFDDFAKALKQRVINPDVEFIAINPYSKCIVELDKNRLAQIFTNFVTNAIKYTPKGYIRMGYKYADEGICLYVEDSGIGIPKEKQSRIFRRFEKLDDFAQGTGLGLSICKAITDVVKGRIGFESEVGKGSIFWAWSGTEAEIESQSKTASDTYQNNLLFSRIELSECGIPFDNQHIQ